MILGVRDVDFEVPGVLDGLREKQPTLHEEYSGICCC